ncbi:MAG TPA: DCL family protein [Candidatus Hydrogenedentes bacterium]|nr:DCL family protein [Candidatus Hydrogenedentota bacterium]
MGGRSKPLVLATRSFKKQGDATAFFKAMLNRYRPGERVSNEDGLDVAALLERHTQYVAKVGCGVSHFQVMMTEHGTQCFRIIRTDGSGTDFSYPHCISQRPPSRKQEVAQAFRRAVRFDLYKARDDFFATHGGADGLVSCAVTGERISRDEAHMDHRPPMTFEVIVTTFLCGRGLSLDDVPLTIGKDDQVSPEITNGVLSEAFRAYHAMIARLDIVRNTVNLAQASRHRLKDSWIALS